VKLLFDQNLSYRLISVLEDVYPGSVHVRSIGLASADDEAVWSYALDQGLTITSKDSDFHQRSLVRGHPPKVVWVQTGNCTTDRVAELLRRHREDLRAFLDEPEASFLILR
jgi:predicted nuclease of predicted toxin-antitoxin system